MSYRICTSCGASDGQGCYSECPTMLQARVKELEKEVAWHKDASARRGEAEAAVLRRVKELEAVLQWIDQQRYTDRSTITPDNAFEQWTRLNADLVAIMDKARAALNTQEEKRMSEKPLTMHPFESVLVSTLEAENARLRTTIGDALECFDCDDYAGAFELLRTALNSTAQQEK